MPLAWGRRSTVSVLPGLYGPFPRFRLHIAVPLDILAAKLLLRSDTIFRSPGAKHLRNIARLVHEWDEMMADVLTAPKPPFCNLRLLWHRMIGRKVTKLDGLRLVCDPALVRRSVSTAIIKGSYEAPERVLVRAALRPGDKVVEVGTGVGVVSLLCNHLAGAGNVTSFEANSALEPIIQKNFSLNGMTPRLRLRAVTVDGLPISFYQNENVVSSSIYDRGLEAEKTTVESDPIDQVLADERATVLVMDVEGAEIDLLRAADLSGLREIIVELHPHIVGEEATRAMIDDVCARGFVDAGRIRKNVRLSRVQ